MPSKVHNKIFSLLNRLGFKVYNKLFFIKMYNFIFSRHLQNSKIVYTCGSGLNSPIRKFYEIPASGSILLCSPFYGFTALGFSAKNSCPVDVETDDIPRIIKTLLQDEVRAQEIAAAGREHIWEKHSLGARSKQLKRCLDSILCQKFAGSCWKNGEYRVNEQDG